MSVAFVTCDLLDDFSENQPEKNIQTLIPSMDGHFFKSYGARKSFGGQIVTVKCHEDNSRVKELLATDGIGKVLVVDGTGLVMCTSSTKYAVGARVFVSNQEIKRVAPSGAVVQIEI